MSVSVGIIIVQIDKYLKIHADTYKYIQYQHILPYSDIATDTDNTFQYIQYILIVIYLHILGIPTNTYNTCIYHYTDRS
jgi:hypothetical protein